MPEPDDQQLLNEFIGANSESAFAALVARYVNLVYSAALRFAGNPQAAEEISQAVFIILARKAAGQPRGVVLSGWLYQAARLTAANYVKHEIRRQRREQVAYMQSTLNEPDAPAWQDIAPLLDEAMGGLGETDRNAVVLRFFENKTSREVAAALKMSEAAAHMRVHRALEKLRGFFAKRGVISTTAIIAGAVSANSVHAAPAGLAKTISAVALAKGAVASTSTLTLVKGALKIMAWTKAKIAITVGVGILLAAGTTTVTIREAQRHANTDSQWDQGRIDSRILQNAPHIVRIIPTRFPKQGGWAGTGNGRFLGLGDMPVVLIGAAYDEYSDARTIFLTKLPQKKYDFIANLPSGSGEAFQREIEKKFGIVAQYETIETNVLFLRVNTPNAPGLRPTTTRYNSSSSQNWGDYHAVNLRFDSVVNFLEGELGVPVVDQTGLTKSYDVNLKWKYNGDSQHNNLKQAIKDQLGLELVPGVAPVKMLVVEKAR